MGCIGRAAVSSTPYFILCWEIRFPNISTGGFDNKKRWDRIQLMAIKSLVLIILDGFGVAPDDSHSSWRVARMPNFERLAALRIQKRLRLSVAVFG